MHDRQIVSAGASGAIFGLMGGLLWIVFANRGRLGTLSGRGMLIMVVLSLYFGFTSTGVDNLAHVGGLIWFPDSVANLSKKKSKDPNGI